MATKKAASTKKQPVKKTSSAKTTTTVTTIESAPLATTNGIGARISQSMRSFDLWRALAAELIGAFLLAGVVLVSRGEPLFVLFALVGIVLLVGGISGAHVNPAVTVGAWVTRRIGWLRAVGYIGAQILGAALAFVVMSSFIGGAEKVSAEAAAFGQTGATLYTAVAATVYEAKAWFVFFAELLGVAILSFAFAAATRAKDTLSRAFTIGIGLFIGLMFAVIATGYVGATAALNPAIAVAIQAYSFDHLWTFALYAIAPAIGGTAGFILYDVLNPRR
jgi:aquaporin Z